MKRYECEASASPDYRRHITIRLANSEREAAEQCAKAFHSAWWVGYNPAGNEWSFMAGSRCVGSVRIKEVK